MSLPRLLRTIRYLKPAQFSGRLRHRLWHPRFDASPVQVRAVALREPGWSGAARMPSLVGPTRLRALNEEHPLATIADWDDPARSHLWRYNAHYFDDLAADDAAARQSWQRALVARWMLDNPPAAGTGWEAYPLSLRIVNWAKWAWAGADVPAGFDASLALQARALAQRIEWHLLGNHLWANAKGLLFAGAYFEGGETEAWRREGARILAAQLDEQWLADGGHFERAPMYHAILLEDLLDLLQLARRVPHALSLELQSKIEGRIGPALRWLATMTHPDGGIAFFNDSALGIAPTLTALQTYARALGIASPVQDAKSLHRPDSGFARLQRGDWVVFADIGSVAPDYLPGHAHAESLCCEVSWRGRRLLVNTGISHYAADAERLRQRGTAAHNAVTLRGQDSSEVWSSFRVGRRARVSDVAFQQTEIDDVLQARHDGYRWLPGAPFITRGWRLEAAGLDVTDDAPRGHDAVAHWHLHPEWHVIEHGDGSVRLSHPEVGAALMVFEGEGADVLVEHDQWHPEFGIAQPATALRVRWQGGPLVLRLRGA